MKQILRFFIPDFVIGFVGIFLGIMNYIKMRFAGDRICQIKEDTIIIVGNGPSLKTTLDESINTLQNNACMVVNGFATSPLFEVIKPKYYILADPVYFTPTSRLSDRNKKVVGSLKDNLLKKVNWDITFIYPCSGKGSELQLALQDIVKSNFMYYNNKGNAVVLPDVTLKYWLWNHNFLAPLSQTVLNTAVSVALMSLINKVYLVGADTSWLATYEIDQKDNTLYTKDEHFYGINRIPLYSNEISKQKQYLHDELTNVSAALKSYYVLAKYAKYNKVGLFNASAYSWIDSLERKGVALL